MITAATAVTRMMFWGDGDIVDIPFNIKCWQMSVSRYLTGEAEKMKNDRK